MAKKLKVQHNGAEIEVDAPEGVLTAEEVAEQYVAKAVHNSEMAKLRKKGEGRVTADELLENDEFKTRALEAWNVKPGKGQADVEAARREWSDKTLKPVQDQLAKAGETITGLRRRMLHSEILAAAASAGVKPQFLKSPARGAIAPIVSLMEGAFGFDEESGSWYVRNGETFAYAAKPAEGAPPYKSAAEYVAEFAGNKENADFVVDQRQRGPGMQQPGRASGAPGTIDASDPYAFARNAEKIAKGEVVVQQ